MANPLKDKSEDELVQQLMSGSIHVPQSPIAQVETEMQRRLVVAIRSFSEESGRQADRMIHLTWWIIALTIVIGFIAGLQLWAMLVKGA
jgi:hypothetical protein